jgi:hypothetical protein
VIPVLCDGVDAPPDGDTLPPPFNELAGFTWRRLRAYDWHADVQRLAADLAALGMTEAASAAAAAAPLSSAAPNRRPVLAAVGLAAALAAGAWWWRRPADDVGPAGAWSATLVRGEQVAVTLALDGERVTLLSAPIDIRGRPDWAGYRTFWRERFGADLDSVIYRAEGLYIREPGRAPRIDLALQVLPAVAGDAVDSGNLSATLSADSQRLSGTVWLNSAQADWPALLLREPR